MSHIRMSHVTHPNESCHTSERVMSHIRTSLVTHPNDSCHASEWVMSHIQMSHVTHPNQSRSTDEWDLGHKSQECPPRQFQTTRFFLIFFPLTFSLFFPPDFLSFFLCETSVKSKGGHQCRKSAPLIITLCSVMFAVKIWFLLVCEKNKANPLLFLVSKTKMFPVKGAVTWWMLPYSQRLVISASSISREFLMSWKTKMIAAKGAVTGEMVPDLQVLNFKVTG